MVILPFLTKLIDMEALEGLDINVYVLFLIYLSNSVSTYLFFAYKKSILMANQRQDVISTVDSIVHLSMYLTQIIVLYCVPNYYIYIIMLPLFTLIDNGVAAFYAHKLYPYISNKVSTNISIKPIVSNIKYLIGHKIGAVIISSADSIVISTFLAMNTLTTYSNYFYVITALNGFVNVGYNAVLAGVGNSIIKESKERIYLLFSELTFLLFYIVSLCSICLFSLYQPFMMLWMGKEFMFDMGTVSLFVIYFYTWQIRVMGLNFKDAAGMWKNDAMKPYVGMVINIILNLVLVNTIGVNGVLVATIVVMVFVYFPWETKVLFRDLFQKSPRIYLLSEFKYLIITILVASLVYYIVGFISLGGLSGLIIKAGSAFLIGNICLISMCYKSTEFKNVTNRIKRMIKR